MMWRNIIIGSILIISGCSFKSAVKTEIKIIGSDTMLELATSLAEHYMKENPGISVTVSGGGTATGIKALINNETDICTASRNLKPDEAKLLANYYGSLGLVFLIAKDALSIYVNPANSVKDLKMEHLKAIFAGKITNWKDLGGKDTMIVPVIRNPNSGTYLYFKEHVLEGADYSEYSVTEATTKDIIRNIETHSNAIGYGGMGYKGKIIDAKIESIDPSAENVRNDIYPIIRYLHFFTTKTPGGIVKKFIDWVLSPSGQSVILKSGFIPLWQNKL